MSDNYEKRAREITPPCALCRAGSIHTVENCPPLRVARELRAVDTAAEARGRTLGMEAAEMPKWIETIVNGFIPDLCSCTPTERGTAACCQNCLQRISLERALRAAELRGSDVEMSRIMDIIETHRGRPWHVLEQRIRERASCETCGGTGFVPDLSTAPPPPGVPAGVWFGARTATNKPCPKCQGGAVAGMRDEANRIDTMLKEAKVKSLKWETIGQDLESRCQWRTSRAEVEGGHLLRTCQWSRADQDWAVVAENFVPARAEGSVSQRDDLEEIAFVAGFSPRVDVPDKQVREWIIAHITDLKSEVQRLSDELSDHVEGPLRLSVTYSDDLSKIEIHEADVDGDSIDRQVLAEPVLKLFGRLRDRIAMIRSFVETIRRAPSSDSESLGRLSAARDILNFIDGSIPARRQRSCPAPNELVVPGTPDVSGCDHDPSCSVQDESE